jgi:photosystem II stability/assembly factor-like uncharacterized protein
LKKIQYMKSISVSTRALSLLVLSLFGSCLAYNAVAQTAQTKTEPLKNLQFRLIGPFRGGRSGAVEGVVDNPKVYFYGATGGGVWKTSDGGINWVNLSDGSFKTATIGAIDAADSDPNIIYVGTGEETVRGNVQSGDGVYKSIDGGKTWKNIGLGNSQQISRVRVHPKDPNIVYVAAMGHVWGNNDERGIFRTKDGGRTWEKVLFRNSGAGASDLAMDPSHPNTLYAAFWQFGRKPYRMDSGGEGSGLFKSTDGGDTWADISRNRGLPSGVLGKINIAVSPMNPDRIWAMVENAAGGLFRSDDGGETWQRVNESAPIRQRPWYFNRVYADTENVDTVYVLNVQLHRSIDGGRTFTTIGAPHGDHHDLWINPKNAKLMINGNDGGSNVTTDAGATWTEQDQPTAQFYRVSLDNDFPYNIYGAQQDNSTVRIASRSSGGSITQENWYDVGGGESGWIAPHPDNSEIVFAGSYDGFLTRTDRRTGQSRDVNPYPDNPMGSGAEGARYRFQWNFPLMFSPHRMNGKWPLYAGSNVLFRSLDEGQSWQAISKDLTRNDPAKQKSSGGPISQDNTSIEYYDTVFAIDESPVKQGVIWVGTDDGLIQLSQDNGATWSNVTPKEMPEWIQINEVSASPFEPGTVYAAAVNYKNDDLRPYLYRTRDYGKTWKKIVNGIPENQFTRCVIEDPNKQGFLYAGTERGLYYSTNDGENWQSLQLNLPPVQIADIAVQKRDKDLVVATHGRSFYVLDNLPVLYQLADAQKAEAFLFRPEDAYRTEGGGGFNLGPTATVGKNPPNGVVVNYYFKDKVTKEVSLEFLDPAGAVIRKFTRRAEPPTGTVSQADVSPQPPVGPQAPEPPVPVEAGLNTFVWNYRRPNAASIQPLILWAGSITGPRVPPGNYEVRLSVDGKAVATENFAIKADPRLSTTQDDLARQYDLGMKINAKISETHNAILDIRDVRTQLENVSRRLKPAENKPLIDMARGIGKKLTDVEEALVQTKIRSGQDALNFPIRLNNKLAALSSSLDSADSGPTAQQIAVFADLSAQVDKQLAELARIRNTELAEFNKQYTAKGLPVVVSNPR